MADVFNTNDTYSSKKRTDLDDGDFDEVLMDRLDEVRTKDDVPLDCLDFIKKLSKNTRSNHGILPGS